MYQDIDKRAAEQHNPLKDLEEISLTRAADLPDICLTLESLYLLELFMEWGIYDLEDVSEADQLTHDAAH